VRGGLRVARVSLGVAQGITNTAGELVGVVPDWELHLLRKVWAGMKQRCENPTSPSYTQYGMRGIIVCERWRTSFARFLEDMGPRPSASHSIDRINNDGHYEPQNCRWATWRQQAENRRPKVLFSVHAYGVEEAIRKYREADAQWRTSQEVK
jgi:hypothetical protein